MIRWFHWVLFGVVVIVALAMSWYSMMDLAVNSFSLPWLLSASVSVIFDVGAVFLGLMSIEYAKTQDSGMWAEIGTYAFALTSVYINVQHAVLNVYGTVGEVMFGAAPVIAAVMLKVMLSFITRQQRRQSGRLVDKLPTVGVLTWFRYTGQTWRLMSVAMRKRLVDAADKLDIPEDRHAIFVRQVASTEAAAVPSEIKPELTKVDTPELVQSDANIQVIMPRTEQDIDDIVYEGVLLTIPDWLPKEPTMSLAKIAEICVQNGETDIMSILSWAREIKGSDIAYATMYKTVKRARQKVQT